MVRINNGWVIYAKNNPNLIVRPIAKNIQGKAIAFCYKVTVGSDNL